MDICGALSAVSVQGVALDNPAPPPYISPHATNAQHNFTRGLARRPRRSGTRARPALRTQRKSEKSSARSLALCLAARPPGLAADRALVAGFDPHRQGRHRRRALHLEVGDGRAGGGGGRTRRRGRRCFLAGRRADPGGGLLRSRAHHHDAAGADARRHVRQGCHACGAQTRAQHLRAHAPPVAALSSRTQDRRPDARIGARPDRHREYHAHGADDAAADHRRVLPGARASAGWSSTGATSQQSSS